MDTSLLANKKTNMENGFIVILRQILKWEWYDDVNTCRLFLHLLLTVNWEDGRWHGIEVKRGQRITSLSKLAKETHLSVKSVRTALEHLKSTHEVAHEGQANFSLLTVTKYNEYQTKGILDGKRGANEGQTRGNNITRRTKKQEEQGESGEQSSPTPAQTMRDFILMVSEKNERYESFLSTVTTSKNLSEDIVRRELDKFADYWGELTKDGKRQRWELESTFEVPKRLGNWFSRINNFSQKTSQGQGAFIS